MPRPIRPRAYPMLLTACLGVAMLLQQVGASPMTDAEIEADMIAHVFEVEDDILAPIVRMTPDGRVEAWTNLGAFEGEWAVADTTLCLFFDDGPKKGETCTRIFRDGEGAFVTEHGERLVRTARGVVF
ncbi:MAG: hypothetical protein ACU0DW_01275 [Shimia sp.]